MRPDDPKLLLGRLFESEFERKAMATGRLMVIRYCDQLGVTGIKAPIAHGPYAGMRLPDFGVIDLQNGGEYWVEAKFKTTSPFFAKRGYHAHGIDLPNWRDYLGICEATKRRGFLVIGEGHTGDILIAPFERLKACAQVSDPCPSFPKKGVFWPRDTFSPWGTFNRRNGQMAFNFEFRAEAEQRGAA